MFCSEQTVISGVEKQDNMSENSAKARVAPNIRDIVELVKTGKLNRAEGFLELREALHSSRQNQVRNHFPKSSVDPDSVGSASADGVSGTSMNTPRSPGQNFAITSIRLL